MSKLAQEQIESIIKMLREGKPLPIEYKSLLFETKNESVLEYASKEREADILADTLTIPLQKVKTFRNGIKGNYWSNMLIFGDNLQVLKTLLEMKQDGLLKNADGTPGFRLIYIDPPFATKREFRGSQDQKAYQDKIAGAEFLEFLRKRLIFLRELLSEDGSIYVHLDWKKGHYVKVLMDELLGENNFRNEIVWSYSTQGRPTDRFPSKHDTIFLYGKSTDTFFSSKNVRIPYSESYIKSHFKDKDDQGKICRKRIDAGKLRIYYPCEGMIPNDVWDIPYENSMSIDRTGYPTQKPEALLERIIKASSSDGDLVLDCFAGSGTTLAVAEKLGRRWIGVDCGKLAIYTIQKRLLNINQSKDLENPKKKYSKVCKPFTLYNAGLYDYQSIKELPFDEYRSFALKLFQCRKKRHVVAKIELDGYLGADHVMVWNFKKYENVMLDKGFIDDLHKYLKGKVGNRFFIIAPASSVQFLEDYTEKDDTKYFVLRIPYSIINEIHNMEFSKIVQPISEKDINNTIDAVGFDFVQPPEVNCKYYLDKPRNPDHFNAGKQEYVIKVETFNTQTTFRKPMQFTNLETLSMVMVDFDYDGEIFDMDKVFFADQLKSNDYEIRISENEMGNTLMVIYIDIFGNEKRESLTPSKFLGKSKK